MAQNQTKAEEEARRIRDLVTIGSKMKHNLEDHVASLEKELNATLKEKGEQVKELTANLTAALKAKEQAEHQAAEMNATDTKQLKALKDANMKRAAALQAKVKSVQSSVADSQVAMQKALAQARAQDKEVQDQAQAKVDAANRKVEAARNETKVEALKARREVAEAEKAAVAHVARNATQEKKVVPSRVSSYLIEAGMKKLQEMEASMEGAAQPRGGAG